MKTKSKFKCMAVVVFLSFMASCSKDDTLGSQATAASTSQNDVVSTAKKSNLNVKVIPFGEMVAYPRGLKFGPDGDLYVALAGTGGTTDTSGQCGELVATNVQSKGGLTGKIIKIGSDGTMSTVVDGLPSAMNGFGDILGPSDIAFVGNDLYVLSIAGCTHGNMDSPTAVLKVNTLTKKTTIVADLSTYLHKNPVAVTNANDFEPDGSPYSMIEVRGDLYILEANHGELIKVNVATGKISRVLDFSAKFGHIVPTALSYAGNFYVGNLKTFPVVTGSSNIYKVTPSGEVKIAESGFSAVLGVAIDKQSRLYVLEAFQAGFPTPGTGRVVRVNGGGSREIIVDNLTFPTAMTFGSDGALYISTTGFGPPTGQIVKVEF